MALYQKILEKFYVSNIIKYSKSLSWAENLNKLFTVLGRKFKFPAQDSDLEHVFILEKLESSSLYWLKATFIGEPLVPGWYMNNIS